jgi:hypothetical protein
MGVLRMGFLLVKIKNMTSEQLSVIKGYQKDYQSKFGNRLEIDWLGMKGIDPTHIALQNYENHAIVYKELEDILKEAVEKHSANLEIIKRRKRLDRQFPKERRALVDFARIVKANKLSCVAAAKLINKDRTMIYHYSNETKV